MRENICERKWRGSWVGLREQPDNRVLTLNEGEKERGENWSKCLRLQRKPEKRVARPLKLIESHLLRTGLLEYPCHVWSLAGRNPWEEWSLCEHGDGALLSYIVSTQSTSGSFSWLPYPDISYPGPPYSLSGLVVLYSTLSLNSMNQSFVTRSTPEVWGGWYRWWPTYIGSWQIFIITWKAGSNLEFSDSSEFPAGTWSREKAVFCQPHFCCHSFTLRVFMGMCVNTAVHTSKPAHLILPLPVSKGVGAAYNNLIEQNLFDCTSYLITKPMRPVLSSMTHRDCEKTNGCYFKLLSLL